MQNAVEFQYFRSVPGKVVSRCGTTEFVGVRRVAGGWEWSDQIVAIPQSHLTRYMREYKRAVADGALIPATKADWEKQEGLDVAAVKAERGKSK